MNLKADLTQGKAQLKPIESEPLNHSYGHNGDGFDYEGKVWGGNKVKVSPTYLNALRLKYCLQDLNGVKGKVLEVGCGAGGMAKAVKAYRPDLEVYGCDISREAIRTASRSPQGVTFEIADAYDLLLKNRRFDAVLMFDVLEHLEDPAMAVQAIQKSLVPGGLFHLFVPCEGALNTLHGVLSQVGWRAKEQYGGHIQLFTASHVERFLKSSGLRPVTKRWSGHLLNQLADVTYFTGLSIRGRNTSASVEGHLETTRPSIQATLLRTAKSGIAIGSYYESRLLAWLPGWGVHILAQKELIHG